MDRENYCQAGGIDNATWTDDEKEAFRAALVGLQNAIEAYLNPPSGLREGAAFGMNKTSVLDRVCKWGCNGHIQFAFFQRPKAILITPARSGQNFFDIVDSAMNSV
jgi:hypothetical protein